MLNLLSHYHCVTKDSKKWTAYFPLYEKHFSPYASSLETLIEIGVSNGGSLEMWAAAFPSAQIVGVDINPRCGMLQFASPNIHVEVGDQCDPVLWQRILTKYPRPSIVIDDGGHFMQQQITTFELLFPHLPIGSTYLVEDCHTSYLSEFKGGIKQPNTFIEYAKTYIDFLHQQWMPNSDIPTDLQYRSAPMNELSAVYFYNSVVVFEKFGRAHMEIIMPASRSK